MKINTSYIVAGGLLLCIAGWFIYHSNTDNTHSQQTDRSDSREEHTAPSVVVVKKTASDHARVLSLYGRSEAAREVSVKAQTAGVIIATPAREGRKINKGAVLCRQDVDARQAVLDQAKATYRTAEVDLNAARTLADKGFQSATRVTAIEAQVDGAKAAIKQAEIELDNVIIRAPFAGIWERQLAEVGDYLAPGQACGLLVELNPLIVTSELTESQIALVKTGQSTEVKLATGETVTGKVKLIEARANTNTRTFRMEVSIPNNDYTLKAGVTADVRVEAGTVRAQNIPSQILALNDNGDVGVRYLNGDNTVRFSPVVTIDEDDNGIWVTGLPEQTRIIVKGQDYVAIGSTVEPSFEGAN